MNPGTYVPAEDPNGALSLTEFGDFFAEIQTQPAWRAAADKEMDYVDGNQLNSEILQKQREIGMPPAMEQLIAPAIDAVLGLEAKNRADWRVTPDHDGTPDALAKAAGFKLNQAERKAKADRACSEAYRTEVCVGIGWVEVSRNPDPFRYPYRCQAIHRNEIWWDMKGIESDMSDARYLIRRRWTPVNQVKLSFPNQKELIARASGGWNGYDPAGSIGAPSNTGLVTGFMDQTERSTIEEQMWNDQYGKRVCLFEVWYRRWSRVKVMRMPDGRVIEYNPKNIKHEIALLSGQVPIEEAVVAKMRQSIWMGPHCLRDRPTPYRHNKFPYVPFWGKKEDRTGVPYGLVRPMIFPQDNVNATTAKLRWGLAAVRVERTEGAFAGSDEQLRREIARPDADIKLNPQEMARQGAKFEVFRDFQLTDQQWHLLEDSRNAVKNTAGISPALGSPGQGTARSGLQEATQVEQGTQMLADLNDNFAEGRALVGELLLSLIIEDMIGKPETVKVPGMGLREDQMVPINQPATDENGIQYLENDIERALLTVAVNDVPSTSSYRAQQLTAMSEAFKSMPPEFQRVTMPYLVALMDLPTDTREDIIKAVREAAQAESPQQIEQRIAKAVADARMKDSRDLKLHELMLKQGPADAQSRVLDSTALKNNVEALYAAYQAAAASAMDPRLAPVADAVAQAAGYIPPASPYGVDPNIQPITTANASVPAAGIQPKGLGAGPGGAPQNTSPMLPPVAKTGAVGADAGIETQRASDNIPS